MKKGYTIVIIVLLVVIAFLLFMLLKKDTDEGKSNTNYQDISNTVFDDNVDTIEKKLNEKKESDYIVKRGSSNSSESFYGYTYDEWKQMMTKFYKEQYDLDVKKVDISSPNNKELALEVYDDENELIDAYTVSDEDGVAISDHEVPVDLEKGILVEYPYESKVKFTDSICVGVGQIDLKYGLDAVAKKYLKDENEIQNVKIVEHPEGGSQAFIIIPRYKDISFSIQECHLGDDGQIYGDDFIAEKITGPIIIKNVEIEYTPKFMIDVEYRGFMMSYPLTFSGEDGSIYLDEYASEMMDISN